MRNWDDIKKEIEEFKRAKMFLVSDFFKGECVECTVNDNTYYGRVDFTGFDQETGRSYIYIKVNKNYRFTWTVIGGEKKSKFYDDELSQIRLIENTFNKAAYGELIDKLFELDELPLSKTDREEKGYEIEQQIMNLRQSTCIHRWEDVEEGSWANKETLGYSCIDCGLRLDKDQYIEERKVQFESIY